VLGLESLTDEAWYTDSKRSSLSRKTFLRRRWCKKTVWVRLDSSRPWLRRRVPCEAMSGKRGLE
jgi:hypothetical protein